MFCFTNILRYFLINLIFVKIFIKRLQKSDIPQNWLACSVNEETYVSNGRLIHEPFDIHIDDVLRLYQVLGNVKRNQSSTVIHTTKSTKKK